MFSVMPIETKRKIQMYHIKQHSDYVARLAMMFPNATIGILMDSIHYIILLSVFSNDNGQLPIILVSPRITFRDGLKARGVEVCFMSILPLLEMERIKTATHIATPSGEPALCFAGIP